MVRIYSFRDSNMAGDRWTWSFELERTGAEYTLTARQEIEDEDPLDIPAQTGLRTGSDIYWALHVLVDQAGSDLAVSLLPSISEQVRELSSEAAADFCAGPETDDHRGEQERITAARDRELRVAPFRERIEAYLVRFSDEQLRYPGGGTYGSRRQWTRRFMEEYVAQHGRLPSGRLAIRVAGYSGGTHDFGDAHTEAGPNPAA